MTQAGELNRRLVLEAPVETADGAGGVTRSYETVTTLWASVVALSAGADTAAASLGAAITHRIVIRSRGEVTTRHRLRDGTRVFRIVSLRESPDRRFLEIQAEESI